MGYSLGMQGSQVEASGIGRRETHTQGAQLSMLLFAGGALAMRGKSNLGLIAGYVVGIIAGLALNNSEVADLDKSFILKVKNL